MPHILLFDFAVPSWLNVPETVANLDDLSMVLSANICIDRTGQPRSAPLLLGYRPLIGNFLVDPTVPRAQETPIEPPTCFVAQPASFIPKVEHPDLIPTGEVSEMAPPIDAYELIGKKSKGASSSKGKGKAKQGAQPKKPRRAILEAIAPEHPSRGEDSSLALSVEQNQLPQIVEIDETEQAEEPAPRPKRARVVTEPTQHLGPSSSDKI